ncbi:MAG TPA: glycosyltransferase family 2 protein [Candidatus Saccharimonadia bacterium]|nr:glycosyltransferase family 2 protein [Candidatus Saccharimonadia bacterium]
MKKPLVSYIFPIFNESGNIALLYQTLTELLAKHDTEYDFEFIFINDGSRDNSLELLVALQRRDSRVMVIDLSRNFGHQIAVTAGLDHARGDAVIIMDSDLQDPPAVSLELLAKWRQGYEVVYAQRRTRKDGFFKQLTARWFYIVLDKLTDLRIPRDTGDFRLMDRRVVDELVKFREHSRFIRGLVSYVGFRQTAVLFDRDERHAGTTGYPLGKMIDFAIDGLLSSSSYPLRLMSQVGFGFAAISFIGIIYIVVLHIFWPQVTVPGWTMIVVSILLIGGLQTIMLGVLGEYLSRVFTEVQNRPLYIVARVYSNQKER